MIENVTIVEYPVFEEGTFERYPALFEPYFHHIPDHQKKKYRKAEKSIQKYEEKHTWPVINGSGFCATTHPGAGKIFNGLMTSITHPVYNSDCLYINQTKNVFALSDPPGATTLSRNLITELDKFLQTESVEKLETIINDVNRNAAGAGLRDRATLALIHISSENSKASFVLSGDSFLFHGNIIEKSISRLKAISNRWGCPTAHFKLREIDIKEGDFFVLASDGIIAMRSAIKDISLDDVILDMASEDADKFAFNVSTACNRMIEEVNGSQARTVFGGYDDISVIMIEPQKLEPSVSGESYIFGGYVV